MIFFCFQEVVQAILFFPAMDGVSNLFIVKRVGESNANHLEVQAVRIVTEEKGIPHVSVAEW